MAAPLNPWNALRPSTLGYGTKLWMSIPGRLFNVLMDAMASAPASCAAFAFPGISWTIAGNLVMTGFRVSSLTQPVTFLIISSLPPMAAPPPDSAMPCEQEKFSSKPSAPASSNILVTSRHCASTRPSVCSRLTHTPCSGKCFFSHSVSFAHFSMVLGLPNSKLVKPRISLSALLTAVMRGFTFWAWLT